MLTKFDLKSIKQLISDANDQLIDTFSKLHVQTKEELKNDIINFKDQILKEIKKLREDVISVTGYKGKIEDHETRIEKLEQVLKPQN